MSKVDSCDLDGASAGLLSDGTLQIHTLQFRLSSRELSSCSICLLAQLELLPFTRASLTALLSVKWMMSFSNNSFFHVLFATTTGCSSTCAVQWIDPMDDQ